MHGASGVGGDKFHQHALALAVIGPTVITAQLVDFLEYFAIEPMVIGEVEESGSGDLALFEVGAFQVQVFLNGLGDLLRGHAEASGPGHSGVARPVPVGAVSGYLQGDLRQRSLGQLALLHGLLHGSPQRLAQLIRSGGD